MSTLAQDLDYFGHCLDAPEEGYRPLLIRAAGELNRLTNLHSDVKCFNCTKKIQRADDWFRCFDCRAYLCEECTKQHFGSQYSPHHKTMEQYERELKRAKQDAERIYEMLKKVRDGHSAHWLPEESRAVGKLLIDLAKLGVPQP